MKNTQSIAIRIKISDIKLSLSADVVSSVVMASNIMYMYMYMHTKKKRS